VWDAGIDMPGHAGDDYTVKVKACDTGDVEGVVLVHAGTFTMGDGGASFCGQDEREVTLTRDFYLGQHEVTNQDYLEAVQWAYYRGYVMATTSSVQDNLDGSAQELLYLSGSEIAFSPIGGVFSLRDAGHGINPDHPVKNVSWYGAARYCDWLSLQAGLPRAYAHSGDWSCNGGDPYGAEGYRLPTDAEWEYAAQYNDDRIYPWGNESPTCTLANHEFCVDWSSPVGSCPGGNSALGLSDMAGNQWEWCNDRFQCDLGTDAEEDPTGEEIGGEHVIRGGSWDLYYALLRCAGRWSEPPGWAPRDGGFRVARTANPCLFTPLLLAPGWGPLLALVARGSRECRTPDVTRLDIRSRKLPS